jgi:GTPase Era involved in 16S rRNA processing
MTARQQRRKERQKTMQVVKTSLRSDANNSLTSHLTPSQSWELMTRIARESWFLQTGQEVPDRVDKTYVRIIHGKQDVSDQ